MQHHRSGASRIRRVMAPVAVTFVAVAVPTVLAACSGSESADSPNLSADGRAGEKIAASMGCRACHSVDGKTGVGPSWKDLYGSEVTLEDGSTVTADEEYLRRSIVDPAADEVEGYRTPMPTVQLTDDQVDQLVTYIKELGPTEGA